MAVDVNKFNLSTTLNIDKVLFVYTSTVNTAASSTSFDIATTSITDRMLPFLSISFDGTNWYSEEFPILGTNVFAPILEGSIRSLSGLMRIEITDPGYPHTIHYRILGVKAL